MFATVLAPPRLIGITWSKCSSCVEPHWRHRPPSRADTAIFTSWVIARLARSPVGGGMGGRAGGCINGSGLGGRARDRPAGPADRAGLADGAWACGAWACGAGAGSGVGAAGGADAAGAAGSVGTAGSCGTAGAARNGVCSAASLLPLFVDGWWRGSSHAMCGDGCCMISESRSSARARVMSANPKRFGGISLAATSCSLPCGWPGLARVNQAGSGTPASYRLPVANLTFPTKPRNPSNIHTP